MTQSQGTTQHARLTRRKSDEPEVTAVETSELIGVGSFRFLAVLLWAASVIPTTILLITAGRVWGQTIAYTPTTQFMRNALVFAVLAWAALIVIRHGSVLMRRPLATIAITLLALFYPAVSGYFHDDGDADELFIAFVSMIVVLALFSMRLNISSLSIVGGLGATTGAVSLAMAWQFPEAAFALEGGGRVLAGPFDNSNYLGTVLILSLPFAILLRRKLVRFFAIILIAAPILMGGSTTSIVTLGVFALLGLVMLAFRKNFKARAATLGIAAALALIFTSVLPHIVNEAGAFTSRGAIWALASAELPTFIPFGAGEEWFERNSVSTGFSINHAHNMLLHPLIVGGLPYLFAVLTLLVMLVIYGCRLAGSGGSVAPGTYTVMLIIAGSVGSFFILDARDLRYLATGFVVVTLLSIATGQRKSPAR